jgi:hypothetical protein
VNSLGRLNGVQFVARFGTSGLASPGARKDIWRWQRQLTMTRLPVTLIVLADNGLLDGHLKELDDLKEGETLDLTNAPIGEMFHARHLVHLVEQFHGEILPGDDCRTRRNQAMFAE